MKEKAPGAVASLLILAALTLICLAPFLGKPFHVDDPLFIWTARQILVHPLNFYGFHVNWDGAAAPMAAVTQNPPLAAYYMAPAGALFGWHEADLHAWFLLPAVALILGTWVLARHFCQDPMPAALLCLCAPVFLLSSASVMCDALMLALWVWAVNFWMAGLARNSHGRLAAAALLISACELTKYFGMSLIPLLVVYSFMEKRRAGPWLAWMLPPILVLVIYQEWTRHLYGVGLLFNAAAYATKLKVGGGLPQRILTELAFTGGCIIALLPLTPLLWGKRARLGGLGGFIAFALAAVALKKFDEFNVIAGGRVQWNFLAQFACFAITGTSLAALAVMNFVKHKDARSLLLLLWVAGTLFFGGVVNWTVSGRNILPMLPAAAILIVRRLQERGIPVNKIDPALAFSIVLAFWAGWSDYRLAAAARNDAVFARHNVPDAVPLYFEGHWGFQYYLEQLGGKPLDIDHHHLAPGDFVILPVGNSYLTPLDKDRFALTFERVGATLPWLATMNYDSGAGYYSDLWGPLPYAFGPANTGECQAYQVR